MKPSIPILLISLIIAEVAFGQYIVVDAASLGHIHGYGYLPDVEGKVLVDQNFHELLQSRKMDDTITVHPFWPVARFGSNERGGVFGNMDNDPELELVYSIGQKTYAFNINGTSVAGWPRVLDYPADGAPAFGDIDGDGFGEIVVTTHETATFNFGTVYAFEINGANVQGFPVTTEGGPLRTPVLADLDDDGDLEIILAVRKWPEGFIHVYQGNGTAFPNWPQRMEYVPGSSVAVGDITGDDVPEIIAESYYSLHAFTIEGTIMDGFPYFPESGRVFSYSSPVLADFDGDGEREIICGDHSTNVGNGAIHVVKNDGTVYPGWPKITDFWIYGPPSVADINDDGLLDIAVGDQVLSPAPINKIYAWTANTGNPLPGFPITNVNGINSQIILADFDDDDMVELMVDDNTATGSMGQYPGFNHDGTPMAGWPLATLGTTFFVNPLVVDLDLDGIMDISGGGFDQGGTGNTNLYLWNAGVELDKELAVLPILQYNTRHNGVYGDYLMVGTPEVPKEVNGGWQIYPNPVSSNLTLHLPENAFSNTRQDLEVEIFQSSGRKVLHQNFKSSATVISFDLTGYPSGIYWLAVKSDTQQEILKFILITR